jgi:hypothetical protein
MPARTKIVCVIPDALGCVLRSMRLIAVGSGKVSKIIVHNYLIVLGVRNGSTIRRDMHEAMNMGINVVVHQDP